MVRFCGLIILPTTPPEVLAAHPAARGIDARLLGSGLLQRGEQRVGAGVRPGHRRAEPAENRRQEGERGAVPAIELPIVMVCPDWFIT